MKEKSSSNTSNKRAQVIENRVVDPISVLHVDDEEIFLQATKIFLEKTTGGKIQVDSLINPEQVFGKLEKKKYDVIVADYIMPSMDGLQLLERLRDQNNNVPYIILTGRGREEVVIKALNLGANRYIKKGMDTESQFSEILHAIEEVVHHKRTYEALQESEKKFRSLIDNLSEIVVEADVEGVFRYVSPQVFEILGYKPEELIGKSCFDHVHPDDMERAMEIVENALKGKIIFNFEYRKKHKDGHYIWVSCSGRFDKENKLIFVIKDITESRKLQKRVQQERQELERAINSLNHPFYVVDVNDYTIQLMNSAAKKKYGEFIQPITCYKLTHNASKPCSSKEHQCPLVEVRKTKKPYTVEHHHFDIDGNVRTMELHCHPVFDQEGNVIQVIEYTSDITERKRTEEALRESEERRRAFMEASPDSFALLDSELNYIEVNKTGLKLLRKTRENVIGKNILELAPFHKETGGYDEYLEVIRTGKSLFMENFVPHPSFGSPFYVSMRAFKVGDGLGVIASDITERKLAEEALEESEERLRTFIYSATDAIDLWDSDLNLIDCNQALIDYFPAGTKKENLIGKNITELVPDIKETGRYDKYIEVLKTGKPYNLESFVSHPKFGDKIFSVQAVKVGDGLGMITSDITERKQAEEVMNTRIKLEQLGARLSSGFVNLPLEVMDQMITNTLKDIAKFAGAVRSSLFLYSEDLQTVTNTHEWCEKPENSQIALLQNIPSDTFGYYWELLQQKKNVVMSFKTDLPPEAESEWEWIREHGWQSALFVPMVFAGKLYGTLGFYGEIGKERQWLDDLVPLLRFVASILINTFERKQAEEALRESEERFRLLGENIEVGLSIVQGGQLVYGNNSFFEITGFPKEEILGTLIYEFNKKQVHHEDLAFVQEQLKKKISGERDGLVPRYQFRWYTKNNLLKWIEVISKQILHQGKPAILGAIIDITKQKQTENEILLVIKELQDFGSIVAHDLKAPLRNMKTIVDWLLRDFADDLNEEVKEYISTIIKLTTHMNMLIDGVYQYSKIDRFHKEIVEINLNDLLSEITEVLSPPDNIKINIQAELPILAVDRTHITQIFSNLIENAIKFMDKPKGHININCEDKKNLYQFSVADTGPGIDESHFERIFQMFQTLSSRDEAKGTGLGLSIVKKIVELNGGKIWLESTVGEGSTFYFTLQKG